MVFTEIKKRNENKYYYRILSFRENSKVKKKRIYMGKNLNKEELTIRENSSDKKLYGIKREMKSDEIKPIFNKIKKILNKHHVKKAGIFGSYARGEQKKSSDVDILVEPTKELLGFNFVGLRDEIVEELQKDVDLITYNGLDHKLKDIILNEEVRII